MSMSLMTRAPSLRQTLMSKGGISSTVLIRTLARLNDSRKLGFCGTNYASFWRLTRSTGKLKGKRRPVAEKSV